MLRTQKDEKEEWDALVCGVNTLRRSIEFIPNEALIDKYSQHIEYIKSRINPYDTCYMCDYAKSIVTTSADFSSNVIADISSKVDSYDEQISSTIENLNRLAESLKISKNIFRVAKPNEKKIKDKHKEALEEIEAFSKIAVDYEKAIANLLSELEQIINNNVCKNEELELYIIAAYARLKEEVDSLDRSYCKELFDDRENYDIIELKEKYDALMELHTQLKSLQFSKAFSSLGNTELEIVRCNASKIYQRVSKLFRVYIPLWKINIVLSLGMNILNIKPDEKLANIVANLSQKNSEINKVANSNNDVVDVIAQRTLNLMLAEALIISKEVEKMIFEKV